MTELINNITNTALKAISKVLFENKIARIISLTLLYLLFIASFVIVFYTLITVHDKERRDYIMNSILPLTALPAAILAAIYGVFRTSTSSDLDTIQLENLLKERLEITHKIENDDKPDIFNTIQLSLNQLNEYYTINKGQARSSFRFSLFAIVIGLLTILVGIWLNYFGNTSIQLTYISGVCGIILEFIGGAYFFMYKKSLEQVNFFFGQLIKIQDTMLSINLANNIDDKVKKIEMHERIIVSLLERSLK